MFSVHWLSLSVIIGPLFPVSLQYQLFLKVVTNVISCDYNNYRFYDTHFYRKNQKPEGTCRYNIGSLECSLSKYSCLGHQ